MSALRLGPFVVGLVHYSNVGEYAFRPRQGLRLTWVWMRPFFCLFLVNLVIDQYKLYFGVSRP